jgi:hypothetical protein
MENIAQTVTRGIRNNNPGNIEKSGAPWQGLAAVQPDPRFVVFSSPEYGIRALAKILLNYQRLHAVRTVDGIIHRYAPARENDTASYVRAVAKALGVDPIEPINVADYLPDLVRAIIVHENGIQPYDAGTIRRGVALALEG